MTDTTGRTPSPQVWPAFRAADARALIRFLVDVFGFTETVVYGEGDRVDHAELAWPAGGGVMLGSTPRDGGKDAWPAPPGSSACYVVAASAADVDAIHARAKAAGAEITQDPHDTDYGSHDFAARDPEGNLWSFGTYPGHDRLSGTPTGR